MRLPIYYHLILVLLLTACASSSIREDRWDQEGYIVTIKEIPDSRITAVEYSGLIDVPPERLWNAATDVDAMFRLTNFYRLLAGPEKLPDNTVRMVFEIDAGWYAPAVTGVMIGRILPDQLGWEDECTSIVFEGCYMRFTILPAGDGKQSMINATGYVKRAWYVSHSRVADALSRDIRSLGAAVQFLARLPKYDRPAPGFPWEQMRHLAQAGPRASQATVSHDVQRPRIAVQRFVTFPEAASASAVGNVAADYLAMQLMTGNQFEVVAPSDLNLMARYLGENWALLCADNDGCKQRLANMADAQYVLSGELRLDAENYHLSLVMLDGKQGSPVWRMQKSVPGDLQDVKAALDEASGELKERSF